MSLTQENDAFHVTLCHRLVGITGPKIDLHQILCLVRDYRAWSPETDPQGDHSAGKIELDNVVVYWSIESFSVGGAERLLELTHADTRAEDIACT